MSVLDKRRILQGSASNLTRVILGMLISLVLPHFLVQHLGTAEYSAWVLILQLSAYVNFLDLGLETAIGKFVAEYNAAGNRIVARKTVSTAFTVMVGAAIIGALAIFGMVWQVPRLFTQMPGALVGNVRCGLMAVGMSVAFALPFGVFLATFTGLQEYGFPTVLIAASRIVSTVGLIALLLMHGTLVQMALLMAVCNIATALLQFVGWKRYASSRIGFQLFGFDKATSSRLLEYCGVLTIWTIGSLLISGLDTAIVGHFDYQNTGYYAIASSATNFMLLLVSNLLGPLLPPSPRSRSTGPPANWATCSLPRLAFRQRCLPCSASRLREAPVQLDDAVRVGEHPFLGRDADREAHALAGLPVAPSAISTSPRARRSRKLVRAVVAFMRSSFRPTSSPGLAPCREAGCRGVNGPGPSASLDAERAHARLIEDYQLRKRRIAGRWRARSSSSSTPSPSASARQSTPTLPRCALSCTSSQA